MSAGSQASLRDAGLWKYLLIRLSLDISVEYVVATRLSICAHKHPWKANGSIQRGACISGLPAESCAGNTTNSGTPSVDSMSYGRAVVTGTNSRPRQLATWKIYSRRSSRLKMGVHRTLIPKKLSLYTPRRRQNFRFRNKASGAPEGHPCGPILPRCSTRIADN
jgi:hypothetical protein